MKKNNVASEGQRTLNFELNQNTEFFFKYVLCEYQQFL